MLSQSAIAVTPTVPPTVDALTIEVVRDYYNQAVEARNAVPDPGDAPTPNEQCKRRELKRYIDSLASDLWRCINRLTNIQRPLPVLTDWRDRLTAACESLQAERKALLANHNGLAGLRDEPRDPNRYALRMAYRELTEINLALEMIDHYHCNVCGATFLSPDIEEPARHNDNLDSQLEKLGVTRDSEYAKRLEARLSELDDDDDIHVRVTCPECKSQEISAPGYFASAHDPRMGQWKHNDKLRAAVGGFDAETFNPIDLV